MSFHENSRRKFLRAAGVATTVPAGMLLGNTAAFAQGETGTKHPETRAIFYDVMASGATGDGKTIDSPAINRAIDDAAASGGGTVFLRAGNYLCYSIHLKSKVALYLDQGATIVAADPATDTAHGYDLGGAEAGMGGLSGLRAQSLAQQSDLGRRVSMMFRSSGRG